MGRKTIVMCLLVGIWAALPADGQRVTIGGAVHERELITLSRDISFNQALRMIQTFANRAIVDPQHLVQPIGIDIDRETWREALEQIAQHNDLRVVAHEHYFELLPGQAVETSEVPEVSLDSREVNISAIFFQADQSALQEFGIDWSTLSGGRVDVRASHMGARQTANDQFFVGVGANINRSLSVDILLQAFESENNGEVIAKPQIKVRSGEIGHIQVGSDFSITTSDYAGNALTSFFSTGTILNVVPVIFSEEDIDFVNLKVEAERSALIDPVRNLISKTVARTSTLLRDGEQTAIAGLYGEVVSMVRSGVPLLKSLPAWFFGLRYLFGFDSRLVSKTELIIMLKIDIVPSVRQRVEREASSANLPEPDAEKDPQGSTESN